MPEQRGDYRRYLLMVLLNLGVLVGLIYVLRRPEPRVVQVITPDPPGATPAALVVQVSGAVATPGVYRLVPAARLADALEQAGGARPEADLSALNLARRVIDGEAILVPTRAATVAPTPVPGRGLDFPTPLAGPTRLNLNTASLSELQALPHIGEVLAERIVEYREAHGGFRDVEELKNVQGIGDKAYADLLELVTAE